MSSGAGVVLVDGEAGVEAAVVAACEPAGVDVGALLLLDALEPHAPSPSAPARARTAMATVRRRARATTELLFL
jgi:hypothetical protein